ncbi:hypothetical protein ACQZ46_24345 [Agrobacterium salinitolerans]
MVIHKALKALLEIVSAEGLINLDFADVQSVMRNMGRAIITTGSAAGTGRATTAAKAAAQNPLFSGLSLREAKSLLVSISASQQLTLFEVEEAASYIRDHVGTQTDMILGANIDRDLGDEFKIFMIAAGLNNHAEVISLADHRTKQNYVYGAAI